ncbi:MAG TPA: PAS domain S-box protein [Anaerolineales bacterium]|nr:PAS domain S-box protein [Anaerolineales bacterium]
MKPTFRIPLRNTEKMLDLRELREQLMGVLLVSSLIVGALLFGFAMIPAIRNGLYLVVSVYSILYIYTILITLVRRIPYYVRLICWLALFYVFGVINLAMNGFNVDAGLFFITLVAMAVILDGLRGGLIALIASAGTISVFGFVMTTQHVKLSMGLPQTDPLLWIIGGMIFLLMGMFLTLTITVFVCDIENHMSAAANLTAKLTLANAELQKSEERYRSLVEISPELVSLLDPQGTVLMVNRTGLNLFRYGTLEEIVGRNIFEFILPEDRDRVGSVFDSMVESGNFHEIECVAVRRDGTQFFAEFNGAIIQNSDGLDRGIIIVGNDISDRKLLEKESLEAKELLVKTVKETRVELERTTGRLTELVSHGPVAIYSTRAEGNHAVTYMSENVQSLLGYSAKDFIGNDTFWLDRLHPEDRTVLLGESETNDKIERLVCEYRFLNGNGKYRWMRDERLLLRDDDGNPAEYVGSWSDITERKEIEETLKESERRYRQLYESIQDAIASVGMDGRIIQSNESFRKMVGYCQEELEKLTYVDLTPARWHEFEAGIVRDQILPMGFSEIYEKEYRRKDGVIFPVELRTFLMQNEKKESVGMWAIVRDISERKQAEGVLRAAEKRYRTLLDNSLQGIIVYQDGHIVYINRAIELSFGYILDDLYSMTPQEILNLVHPEDRSMIRERLQLGIDELPDPVQYTFRILHGKEGIHWLVARTISLDYNGKPALQTSTIDITDLIKAGESLKESEERYRLITETSLDGIFQIDSSGVLRFLNDSFAQTFGYSKEELIGCSLTNFIQPEDVVQYDQFVKETFSGAKFRGELAFHHRDSHTLFMNVSAVAVINEGQTWVTGFVSDMTDYRRIQGALRRSAETNEAILNAANAYVALLDPDGNLLSVNSKFADRFRKTPEEMIGQYGFGFLNDEIAKTRMDQFKSVLETGKVARYDDYRAGIWFDNSMCPVFDKQGKVASIVIYSTDVTNRIKMEELLRQSEERYRTLAEAAPEMIFIIGRVGGIEYVNSNAAKFLGSQVDDVIGKDRRIFFSDQTLDHQNKSIARVFEKGESFYTEEENTAGPRCVWMGTWLVPLRDAAGEIISVMGIARDITKQKQTELALLDIRDQLEKRVEDRTAELIASQEQLRRVTNQIVTAQEEERRRVSRELHDEASQALITLKYSMALIDNELPEGQASAKQRLADAAKIIDQTVGSIRTLAHSLRPPVLEIGGINLSLKDYCMEFSERTDIRVEYQGVEILGLPDEIGISLYRVVQETLTNTLKHAQATSATVKLEYSRKTITLSVADNGRGIEGLSISSGIGLLGIEERIKLLGGNIKIQSRKGSGVKLIAVVPWASSDKAGTE